MRRRTNNGYCSVTWFIVAVFKPNRLCDVDVSQTCVGRGSQLWRRGGMLEELGHCQERQFNCWKPETGSAVKSSTVTKRRGLQTETWTHGKGLCGHETPGRNTQQVERSGDQLMGWLKRNCCVAPTCRGRVLQRK